MDLNAYLEKLYSNQYFGVVIFSIIGVLALLFIIVLVLALKDAKKRKLADSVTVEADKESKMAKVAFAQEATTPTNVAIPNEPTAPTIKDDVVEIKPTVNNTFETVNVPEPTPIAVEPAPVNMAPVEPVTITPSVNPTPENNQNIDISKEQDDLTAIAQSLAAEYKKETGANESTSEPTIKPAQPEQFSSVYVTPEPMPNTSSATVVPNNMPNIADIPVPQPIKVENENKVFDSGTPVNTNPIDNINAEEYKLK
jgi:type II secretory pathway pseudopilin PulG